MPTETDDWDRRKGNDRFELDFGLTLLVQLRSRGQNIYDGIHGKPAPLNRIGVFRILGFHLKHPISS